MKFYINHLNKFKLPSIAFCICFMQFVVDLLCEIYCILFFSNQDATIDVIFKFVSLAKITQIDNFY